jgi:AraC-like DNA-binding protein
MGVRAGFRWYEVLPATGGRNDVTLIYLVLACVNILLGTFLTAFAIKFRAPMAVRFTFALVAVISMPFLVFYLTGSPEGPVAASLVLICLHGPIVWWLVRTQISGATGFFSPLHLLPALLLVPILVWASPKDTPLIAAICSALRLGYMIAGATALLLNRHSLAGEGRLLWLAAVVLATVSGSVLNILGYIQMAMGMPLPPDGAVDIIKVITSNVVTLCLMWWALMRPQVYLDHTPAGDKASAPETAFDRDVFERLEKMFLSDRPFLDPALKLEMVADQLAVTPRELTNAVNRCAGKSFRAYMGEYRLEEAKRLLADRTRAGQSVYDIAMEAGFGTKSTFNDAFKAFTGLTPSAFRETELQQSATTQD